MGGGAGDDAGVREARGIERRTRRRTGKRSKENETHR